MKRFDARRRSLLLSLPVLAFAAANARAATGSAAALPFEPETFGQIVAAAAGRPLIVHLWGLTCAPCLEELPRWGAFVRRHPDVNAAFIQVDPMPFDRLAATLRRAKLEHARNWSARARVDERWRYRIDPDWAGELPRTVLIAGDGQRVAISGGVDFEALREWIGRQGAAPRTPDAGPRIA